MATWVYFDSIVAVQSKLRGLLHLQTVGRSTAVSALPWITTSGFHAFTFSKRSVGPDHLCKSHPATDTTPPGRTTTSASAALGQTTCAVSSVTQRRTPLLLDVQLLRDALQPDQVCSPSANGGAATEARSCRGTRASWARTPFTVCGLSLQQFSPGRHEAPPRPRRG